MERRGNEWHFKLTEQPVHNPVVEKTVFDNNKGNQSRKCSQIRGPKAKGEKMGQWQVVKLLLYRQKKKSSKNKKIKHKQTNKNGGKEMGKVIVARRRICPEWVGGHGRVRTARRWFWKAESSSQGQLGRQVRTPYFHQIDKDTEVSNSHVPIQELLFMNLETAKHRSQLQPNTSTALRLTQLVNSPFFRDVAISLLIRGSHILWWHQSTSQQISYCRVGKSFCWSSHLWLLSLWVAPVYLNSERLLRPIAPQTGLELFKPCGKWLMEKVRGAQFSPPTRWKRNQSRSCLKELLDLGNWKETA